MAAAQWRGHAVTFLGVVLQDRGGSGPHMLSGQVANYVFLGFFQRARHTAQLTDVLDNLKQNLK